MKILLLGEYSNLHWTLAQGLREFGHNVTVASSGDRFKDCSRDITLRRNGYGIKGTLKYIACLTNNFRKFRNYDIVQVINPMFLDLRAERILIFYNYLKKHNKKVFLGAFGPDYFNLKAFTDGHTFRYSEYCIGKNPTGFPMAAAHIKDWIGTGKQKINIEVANTCDGIIACLYEYYVSYLKEYKDKLVYIPEPINTDEIKFIQRGYRDKVRFFIGIQTARSQLKGTDILYRVLKEVEKKHPDKCIVKKAESLPYAEYVKLMDDSDVLVDQLYSYTPAMNAFAAMAKGLVIVGGGEPETYEILGEEKLKPLINVIPDEQDIFQKLEQIVLNKDKIPELSLQSRQFVEKHHDYKKVARQYMEFWTMQQKSI